MSQSSYNEQEVIDISQGKVFGPNAPKLPMDNMLMVTRIVEVSSDGGKYGKGLVVAELDINPDLWFFGCHFLGDPVMPGCLGLDALWQLTGFFLAWSGHEGKGRALGVGELKFTGQVLPENKKVTYTIDIRRVMASKLVLAMSDGTMSVDDKDIYFAKGMKVGLFTDETPL